MALAEPSEPCEIETEGDDEPLDEDEEEELVGAGAGAGAEGCGAEGVGVAAGVTDATAGALELVGTAWWTAGVFAAT